jgi:hypothetical protein
MMKIQCVFSLLFFLSMQAESLKLAGPDAEDLATTVTDSITSSCKAWQQATNPHNWTCKETEFGITLGGADHMYNERMPGKDVVFWHLEKGGGSSAIAYLGKSLGPKTRVHIVNEFGHFTPELWSDHYFKIGLVREPCAFYNSVYNWGPDHGFLHLDMKDTHSLSNYWAPKNKEHFKAFLQHLLGTQSEVKCGVLSMRTWTQVTSPDGLEKVNAWFKKNSNHPCKGRSYHSHPCPAPLGDFVKDVPRDAHEHCNRDMQSSKRIDDVDCWLRTESLSSDFVECMAKFKQDGGELSAGYSPDITKRRNNGNPHASCQEMYDPELAALVEKVDGAYAKRFGYTGKCCEKHPSLEMIKPEPASVIGSP